MKKIKWTKEKCLEEALKYNSRGNFSTNSRTVYSISCKHGWIHEICKHMTYLIKPKGYWTKEKCLEEALKYKTKEEFFKKNRTAYEYCRKNKWLDQFCTHMTPIGNRFKRLVYAFIFPDNYVYIGLTYNPEARQKWHLTNKKSPVFKHFSECNIQPIFKILTEYTDVNKTQINEEIFVKEYINLGYLVLNKAKTGGLGNTFNKWTFENCKKQASKYKTRWEFGKNVPGAYKACLDNKWLEELCKHMICVRKPNGYWNYENCKTAALNCKNKEEYYKKFGGAFTVAKKQKWLNDFFKK